MAGLPQKIFTSCYLDITQKMASRPEEHCYFPVWGAGSSFMEFRIMI
jgi:hypothetical protein